MTEDIFILDCHSDIFVWVGQQIDSKNRIHALTIGEVCIRYVLVGIQIYTWIVEVLIFQVFSL